MWNQLIKLELLVLMPFLYGLGVLIKNTPNIKDWLIPYILLGISIVITVVYIAFVIGEGFNGKTIVMAIIQGTFLALATVGGNELYKQATCGRKEDNAAELTTDEPEYGDLPQQQQGQQEPAEIIQEDLAHDNYDSYGRDDFYDDGRH